MTTNLLNNLSNYSAPFGIRWKPAFNMHKTPSTPSRFARLAAMVTLLLTLACGNAWGADQAASSTKDISAITSSNWGTWTGGTPVIDANGFHISSPMGRQSTSNQTWVGYVSGNTGSVSWSAGTNAHSLGKSAFDGNNNNVNAIKLRSNRKMYFRITGCTDVYALVLATASQSSIISAYEYSGGSRAGSATATANTNSTTATEISVTGLDESKTYEVEISASGTSDGCYFYEICFVPASVSSWKLKGDFDSWGDGYAMTGSGTMSVTRTLTANTRYEFKFHDGSNYYGNTGAIVHSISGWTYATDKDNCILYTGPAGDYTFSINTSTKAASVTYPTVDHPNANYVYIKKGDGWSDARIYNWDSGSDSKMSDWAGSPTLATTTICGTEYWYGAAYFNKLKFRDGGSNESNNMDLVRGKWLDETTHASAWSDFSTYTITYAANGGGGSMSATSGICPDADQAITSNAFTAPTGCASFAHWTANVAVKVGGATVAAGNPIANGATIEDINSNITLTAVWKLAAPTITDNGDNTFSISGSMAGSSYYYTTNSSTPTTSSSLYSSAVDFSAGEANITAKAIAHKDGYVDSDVASQACTYHAAVTCTGDPTALVSGTLYKAQDMKSACFNTVDGDFVYGLSANDKFYITGTTNGDNSSTGTVEIKGQSKTIDAIAFDSIAWLKGEGSTTHRSIKFVTGGAGTLTVYGHTGKNAGNVRVKPSASSAVNVITASSSAQDISGTYDVTAAGTYYILSNGSSAAVYGIKFVAAPSCTTPAAPTAFSAGSITSTGATFSITDAGDAASYDIYYSTSSDAPTASTPATTTSTSKTKAVTGLTASTTYYAWVRSVCDADHKSAWVALGTTSFTTSAAEPDPLVHWTMKINNSAWGTTATATTDGTNITSINTSRSGTATGTATSATVKVTMASAEVSDNSAPDNSANFTFTVNSAKKVVPEKVTCQVFNVSSGNRTYKAQISDNNGHVYNSTNTLAVSTEATLTDATFNFASGGVLVGDVTLKIYAWKTSGSPTEFRMGQHVKLFGEVQNAADYTVTHTMSNVTKSAGATSVKEGNNYTATYAVAGDYALPENISVTIGGSPATAGTDYTWTQGTGVVSIPGDKVTGNIVITVTGVAVVHHDVTFSLTNVVYSSGNNQGTGAATEGSAFSTVFAASSGYSLPGTITVTIGGVEQTAGTGYTWAQGSGTLTIPAAYVTGDITVTIVGEELEGDGCEDLVSTEAATATSLSTSVGTATLYNPSSQSKNSKAIKLNSSGYIELSPKAGKSFAAGDSLIVVVYNQATSGKTTGFKIGTDTYTASIAASSNHTFRQKLTADNIVSSKVKIERESSDGWFVSAIIKHCEDLPSCTTPSLPTLSNQTVCPGSDIAAWDATPTNIATITGASEDVEYSWKKKGSETVLGTNASFDLGSSATEGMAGTYVVTVTVSKTGYISKLASAEVDLTVTPATEEPAVTQSPATVYVNDGVTLTATCGSAGTITWAWYTCNSDGTGESVIAGKTTATCAITAPAVAGTYYYKVKATGDGTNACGTAEHIHSLVVKAASECENYFWFTYADDATTNGVINNRSSFFSGAPTGSSNQGTYKFTVDGTEYTATRNTGSTSISISFTVPEGSTADFVMNGKSSSSNTVTLSHSGGVLSYDICASGSYAAYGQTGLVAGTWTLTAGSNWTLAALAVHVCHESTCTDAVPEIAAANTTVCVGTELSISATGYEDGATFQWQKLNSSTSTWDNISGATSATYSVAEAAAANVGSYRLIATAECARTSNTVTISVPSAPVFEDVPSSVSVMQNQSLSIANVSATNATGYKWYKSTNNNTFEEGTDTKLSENQTLVIAEVTEAVGNNAFYLFCVASNSCGTTTADPIAVNVTEYVEEDCAIRGNEGDAEFGFENTGSVGTKTYNEKEAWRLNSGDKYFTYSAPEGKYLASVKFHIAHDNDDNGAYGYSTDHGANWTYARFTGLTSSWGDKTIDLSALNSEITDFRIGRKLGSYGNNSGSVWVYSVCFEYSESCAATHISVSDATPSYTMSGDFPEPTFSLKKSDESALAGTLTYTSSNEDIATVDDDGIVSFQGRAGSVKITASFAGGEIGSVEYCASSAYYTITVTCGEDEAPKVVAAGGTNMSGCNTSVTLNARKQNGTSDFSDGSYIWYRDGAVVAGETTKTITVTRTGVYTVERIGAGGCITASSNSATVTSSTAAPDVERLAPFQYYHKDKVYPESSIMRYRHLFAVKNGGTKNGKRYEMTMKRNNGDATDVTSSNSFKVITSADNTIDTVLIDLNKLKDKYAVNDELELTCKAIDCNGSASSTIYETIVIHVIDDTPTLALICAGEVNGDFFDDYEPNNLKEEVTEKGNYEGEWSMYTDLKSHYSVTPVNGYAEFNKFNYEPYDILFLTDYPNRKKHADLVNGLADLVDFRPMFSFKAHMAGLSKWAQKGFTADPAKPEQSRLRMNIVCYAHPMFEAIDDNDGTNIQHDSDDPSQIVYRMLTKAGYESGKGIQGFKMAAADNFVTIGLVHSDATAEDNYAESGNVKWTPGSKDEMLVAAAERQAVLEARMVMFSLNEHAHSCLSETGRNVVLKCLEYLLSDATIEDNIADCSWTFDNNAGDNKWSTVGNWLPDRNAVPGAWISVRIKEPVVVDVNAKVLEARLIENGKITIPINRVLDVHSTIRRKDGSVTVPTDDDDIIIQTTAEGQGALIFNNDRGDSHATVNLYSKGRKDGDNYQFQYIAMPMGRVPVHPYFEGSDIYTYAYKEATGWERRGYYTDLYAFEGIGITTKRATASNYTLKGALTSTESQTLSMTYANSIAADKGYNMFGNSWSAPIQISQLRVGNEDATIQKTVYIYVAGKDPVGGSASSTTEVAGKWLAIPFDASGFDGWTGLKVIPAFQAFEIEATAATTFNLDYSKMVRGGTTDMNAALRAPKRRTAEHEGIELMVLHLAGGKVNNDLFMFEGEQFSDEFDNGWEATFKEDEEIPTQLYSPTTAGKMAVAALPTLEGAKVNFTTNEAGEYTFTFSGAESGYYLNDLKEQKSALVKEGNAYVFTLEDGEAADRFYISRTPLGAPAIATGVDEIDAEAMKVRKIIHNDQLYIIRGGQLYDATGKVVK